MKPLEHESLLDIIRHRYGELRKSERKVADFVLNDPSSIIKMRIVDFAAACEVSEPTVIRFCRAVECEGFQDFKLSIAQLAGNTPSFGQFEVSDTDALADFNHKVFDSTIDTLQRVRDQIDYHSLEQAIHLLGSTSRIEFYGFGASAPVAADAQHKFFRLHISTAAYSDPHIQTMSAISLKEGDIVFAISQSGRTKDLVDSINLAKDVGAKVISLSPANTPVSNAADVAIHINVEDSGEIYRPLSSRIAHQVIIDVLAVGVAQLKGEPAKEHLKKITSGLQKHRR